MGLTTPLFLGWFLYCCCCCCFPVVLLQMSSGKYLSLHWLWIYSFAGGALHSSRCAEPNLCRNQEGPKCRHAMERGQRLLAPLRSCCLHFCWMHPYQILGVFDHSWKKSGWRITDQKRVKSCPALPKSSCTLPMCWWHGVWTTAASPGYSKLHFQQLSWILLFWQCACSSQRERNQHPTGEMGAELHVPSIWAQIVSYPLKKINSSFCLFGKN